MFREAYNIARHFTAPVVLSRLAVAGHCSSGIGTFVVINKEGWIVTAWHIIEQFNRMATENAQTDDHDTQVKAIMDDASLAQIRIERPTPS